MKYLLLKQYMLSFGYLSRTKFLITGHQDKDY